MPSQALAQIKTKNTGSFLTLLPSLNNLGCTYHKGKFLVYLLCSSRIYKAKTFSLLVLLYMSCQCVVSKARTDFNLFITYWTNNYSVCCHYFTHYSHTLNKGQKSRTDIPYVLDGLCSSSGTDARRSKQRVRQ